MTYQDKINQSKNVLEAIYGLEQDQSIKVPMVQIEMVSLIITLLRPIVAIKESYHIVSGMVLTV